MGVQISESFARNGKFSGCLSDVGYLIPGV